MLKLRLPPSAWALILMASFGMSSAETTPPNASPTVAVDAPDAQGTSGPQTPALQEHHPRYQVMPSDVLAVSFPLIPEIPVVSVTVQPDGYITLPNDGGNVFVQGETVPQIIEAMTKAYSKTMHTPIVSVNITNFQPPLFTVNGQVGKPGQYALRIDTTVTEGIAVAGGFLPSAKTQVFLFHRVSGEWVEVKKVNIKQLLNGHHINEDIHIQAGDMIFVPDKFITRFRKYVPYALGLGSGLSFNGTTLLAQ